MSANCFSFVGTMWEHIGTSAWFFVSLPESVTDEIDEMFGHRAAGFGSLRVQVTIGVTTWKTSIFPDTKRGTFVLPVKKAVRTAEHLCDGSVVEVELEVLAE
jgi:Domain of unknown function (DUF1905)